MSWRIMMTAAIMLGVPWLTLTLVHPNSWATLRLLAYLMGCNLAPGLGLVMLLSAPGVVSPGVQWLLGWAAGLALNMLVVTLLWLTGGLSLLWALPLAGAAMLAVVAWRHRAPRWPSPGGAAAALAFLCITPLLSMAHVLAGDPWDGFSFHAGFQALIVRGLEQGWPPPNLMLPDVPWAYNYTAHLWVLGAVQMTGLPLDMLTARLAPMVLGATAAAGLLGTGRIMFGLPWWVAALPVVALHWVIGLPPVSAGLFGSFMPFGANIILSPYPAMVLFLGTLLLQSGRPGGAWRFLALAALTFLGTGTRGVVAPILICALGLHMAAFLWKERRLPWRDSLDFLALVVGLAAGLLLFFRLGSEFSGTGFVQFNGHPFTFLLRTDQYLFTLPHWLLRQGMPPLAAATLAFLVIAVFHGGFLAPAVAAGLGGGDTRQRKAATLLSGGALAGVSAFFLTEAPGYSHVSFLYFSGACLALLGARGLDRLLTGLRRLQALPMAGRLAVLAIVLALAGLRVAEWRGPATAWLMDRAWQVGTGGGARPPGPVVTCHRAEDDGLLASLPRNERPLVILLPRMPDSAHHCNAMWLLVANPVQGLSSYALTHLPGSGRGALAQTLKARTQLMSRALAWSAEGHLPVRELALMRATLDPRRPVFVLAAAELAPDQPGLAPPLAGNDRYRLWRLAD